MKPSEVHPFQKVRVVFEGYILSTTHEGNGRCGATIVDRIPGGVNDYIMGAPPLVEVGVTDVSVLQPIETEQETRST